MCHGAGGMAGHVQFGLDLLRSTRPAVGRRRLAASTALAGLGAGRILAFDLGLTDPARRYYGTAALMAEQAEDHFLAAAISGHMATLSFKAGKKIVWDDQARKYHFIG